MHKRFVSIWFRHLTTDWLILRRPSLRYEPFVFSALVNRRMTITATSIDAEAQGISLGMPVADAKAIVPSLQVFDEYPEKTTRLLKALGEWCIRYSPIIALDPPHGLILDASGCAHLWGGEKAYLKEIVLRLRDKGYDVRAAMADTIGAAWAIARYGKITPIIEHNDHAAALLPLPPAALRLELDTIQRLKKLGLHQIKNFINMPRSVLRRRFGEHMLLKIDQTLGLEDEIIQPLIMIQPYQERLPFWNQFVPLPGLKLRLKDYCKYFVFVLRERARVCVKQF